MGLFHKNYDTPGKGVSKNEPEKKSFFKFFEILGRNFWKIVNANLLYLLVSLPIVTGGIANVGLTYVSRTMSRDKHVFLASDFFGAIKRNWKRATAIGIINLIITLVFGFNVYTIIYGMEGTWRLVMLVTNLVLFVYFHFASFYMYLICITFDFKVSKIYKNSFMLATLGIKNNVIIFLVELLIIFFFYFLLLNFFAFGVALLSFFILFLYPAARCFLVQFNAFSVIRRFMIDPYYKDHPDEDIEKRRELGIYEEPEDDDEDDENVFSDETTETEDD